VDVVEE
jgi:hypothetical protein